MGKSASVVDTENHNETIDGLVGDRILRKKKNPNTEKIKNGLNADFSRFLLQNTSSQFRLRFLFSFLNNIKGSKERYF